ncbi:hypothetical protein [Metabacillus niabensis]|uniref:hypothetical protein n=1 Tax=Metabacillus niabensis TaxID=324854 RepID=UPI001CFAD4F2|nr:hypothetical protein [Metabacillus niabensis]
MENTMLQQKLIHMKSELSRYKAQVEDYENNYHYSQLRKLKHANANLLEEKNSISLQLDITKKKIEELQNSYQLQVGKNKQLEFEYIQTSTRLKKEIETLIEQDVEKNKEISYLIENKSKLEAINNKLKAELYSLKNEIVKKQEIVNEIELKYTNLQKGNQKISLELREYRANYEEALLQYENINIEKTEIEQKLLDLTNAVNNEKMKLKTEIETKEISIEKQAGEINQLKEQIDSTKLDRQQYEELINIKDKEILQKNNECDFLKNIITKLNEDKLQVRTNGEQLQEQIYQLKKGNEQILQTLIETNKDKHELNDMKTILHSISNEIYAFKSGHSKINEQIEKVQQDIDSFIPKFEFITSANDDTMVLLQIEKQIKNLINESIDYEIKLDTQIVNLDNLERNVQEVTEELMKIEKDKNEDQHF